MDSTSRTTRTKSGRNAALDGLRGYAAITVIFFHSILGSDPDLIANTLIPSAQTLHGAHTILLKSVISVLNGELAVAIFFVISGIVLFRSLRLHDSSSWSRTAWTFAARRFLRIYPVMAVALIAKPLVFAGVDKFIAPIVPIYTVGAVLTNLSLKEFPVIGATWTLHAELWMVPVLLICFFGTRLFGPLILIAFAYVAAVSHVHRWVFDHDVWLIVSALNFILGGAIECGLYNPLLRSRFAGIAAALGVVGMVASVSVIDHDWIRRLPFQAFCTSLLVGWVYAAKGGPVIRWLESRTSRYFGRISYSIYLWNVPVFELMLAALPEPLRHNHPLEVGLVVGLLATLIAIPISHVSEKYLEQPCIALGRRITRARRPVAASAPAPGLVARPVDAAD